MNEAITIDCQYREPEHAASYLLIENGRAAFIENNTVHAVPILLDALGQRGLSPANVDHIIITHLHLDHAGGTSALVERCPNAMVLAHPRAVRHLENPSRLIEGVKLVYGDAEFERLYAPIHPIDPTRIRAMDDNEELPFGGRALRFLHTLGHSKHHMCIYDSGSNSIFTGDSFGVGFRASRKSPRPFMHCSTAPPDFDPAEARASVARILNTGAERAFPTHFGELRDIREGAAVVLESIDQMEVIARKAIAEGLATDATENGMPSADLLRFCREHILAAYHEHAHICGAELTDHEWRLLEHEVHVDAQGLAIWALSQTRR